MVSDPAMDRSLLKIDAFKAGFDDLIMCRSLRVDLLYYSVTTGEGN